MESGDTAYMSIMPLLLDMLRNVANTPGYHQLHAKAMECATVVPLACWQYRMHVTHIECSATAVGRKVFERVQSFR